MRIRVMVADDSEVVRKAIARLLGDDSEIQIVAETDDFGQTMHLAGKLKPEVIVLDLHMGEEVSPAEVKSGLAGSRLLAICVWNDAESQALADSFGAVTLLSKGNLATELIPAIKQRDDARGRSQ